MTEEHGHCEICGRVVPYGTRFHDASCEEQHRKNLRSKKINAAIFIGLVTLFFLLNDYI